jgi:nicotinate-nucleotide pyrophosphorylase (carboxylating)
MTAEYVERIRGTRARILDTRKTAPGMRELDKAAVRAGAASITAWASSTWPS